MTRFISRGASIGMTPSARSSRNIRSRANLRARRGIILVQLENEYDYAGLPDDVMINQVKALGEAARAGGIDVPLFTCWTHPVRGSTDLLRQVFDACNFYPRWSYAAVPEGI